MPVNPRNIRLNDKYKWLGYSFTSPNAFYEELSKEYTGEIGSIVSFGIMHEEVLSVDIQFSDGYCVATSPDRLDYIFYYD